MNIYEAVQQMRQGKKVRRACNIGATVAKCYLIMKLIPIGVLETEEIIFFVAEAITEKDNWIETHPETRNIWKPNQKDILAEDWTII